MGKRFSLENTLGFNDTRGASLNYNKDRGLEQNGEPRRCQWLTGECSDTTTDEQAGYGGQAVSLAAPTVLTCPHTRPLE